MVSAGHAGALYRQLKGPTGRAATFEDLVAQDEVWGQNPFFSKFRGRAQASYNELLGSMREIHKDNTAWPVERAKKVASDLLLVDGQLWRRDLEPIWTVTLDREATTDYQKPFPNSIQPGIPFPLLDRVAAEETAAAWAARAGVKFKSSGMTLQEADGRFLVRDRDGLLRELMTTAFHSARRALTAQYWMSGLPADIASKVDETEAMLMPGGMLSGAAERIDSLFRQIDRDDQYGIPAPRGSWLTAVEAAVALGLEPDLIAGGPSIQFDPNDELLLGALA
ncbi:MULTISPECIES: hypothetical protein [unclassified Bradyrhizobium]